MPIDLSTFVKQARDQVSCNLNDDFAILNLKSTLYFGVDQVGAHIWGALKEPIAAADIIATCCHRFDVSEEQCRMDILDFLRALEDAGLIEIKNGEMMARKQSSMDGLFETEEKRSYTDPKLITYGTLQEITANVGNTGNLDGGGGPTSRTSP